MSRGGEEGEPASVRVIRSKKKPLELLVIADVLSDARSGVTHTHTHAHTHTHTHARAHAKGKGEGRETRGGVTLY